MMSIGLACDHVAGRIASSAAISSGDGLASLPPEGISASTASTPAPPPLVRIRSSLSGTGLRQVKVSAAVNKASRSSTRTSPARRNAAATALSFPARAPVWVAAARADNSLRPDLITTTGLARAADRLADMNFRAEGMVSR